MSDNDGETPKPRQVESFLRVVGTEPATPEQEEAYIRELINLKKKHGAIAYEKRRDVIATLIPCSKKALDERVKELIKAEGDDTDMFSSLVDIGIKRAKELWHHDEEGYVTLARDDGHLEHLKVNHPTFRHFLSKEYGKTFQRGTPDGELVPIYPDKPDLDAAIYQLNLHAIYEGKEYRPRVRLNYIDDALWLDLGRPDWKCVRITSQGWQIRDRCEAKIIRGSGAKALPIPVEGGDIRDLRRFLNVRDDAEFVLFLGQIVGLYNVFGNYTTTIVNGPAGSAKTTAMRVMRKLIDPHEVMERPFVSSRDLMHSLADHHVQLFENISKITQEMSDAFCRLNTGTGYAERKLFNQGIQFQVRGHCPVMLNGIPSNMAEADDLLQRSVTFNLELITDAKRMSEDGFNRAFERAWPKLLGCVLDGVVGALRSRHSFDDDSDAARTKLLGDYNPRFVDHVVWAEAACQSWGFPPGALRDAYRNNQGDADRYFAEHDPLCIGIKAFMAEKESWRGAPEKLYRLIQPIAMRYESQFGRPFPVRSAEMGKQLPRSIGALWKVYGIAVKRFRLPNRNANGIEIVGNVGSVGISQPGTGPQKNLETDGGEIGEISGSDFFPEPEDSVELPTLPTLLTKPDEPEPRKPPTQPFVIRRR